MILTQWSLGIFKLRWREFYTFSNSLGFSLSKKSRPIATNFKVRHKVIQSGSFKSITAQKKIYLDGFQQIQQIRMSANS